MARGQPRLKASTELLVEFLDVAIQVILYERGIYPESIFSSQRAFGVPVKMSRHPEVNDYIRSCLRDATPLIDAGAVENIVVVIIDGYMRVAERFVFGVSRRGRDETPDPEAVEATEYAMRALLTKLALSSTSLPPVCEDATFRLLIETRADADGTAATLIETAASDPSSGYVRADQEVCASPVEDATVVPVRKVATPLVDFSLNVECAPRPDD